MKPVITKLLAVTVLLVLLAPADALAARGPSERDRERMSAVAALTVKIQMDPGNPALYLERSALYDRLNHYQAALNDIRQACGLQVDYVQQDYCLADAAAYARDNGLR